jgi:23S rRNA (uracil1939-C5)-methyltransferase
VRSRGHRNNASAPPVRAVVRIEDLGAQGDGIARREDGKACFIPLSAPGDLVEAEFRADRGRISRLVEAGPDRRAAPCPQFGSCGGCAVQHLEEPAYRRWKERLVADAFARRGLVDIAVAPLWSAPVASRRRATFAVRKAGGSIFFGFNFRRSDEIASVDGCVILHPDLYARRAALKALAGAFPAAAFDMAVTQCDNGLDVNFVAETVDYLSMAETERLRAPLRAAAAIRLSVNGATMIESAPPVVTFDGVAVSPPPAGFLQASREAEAAMTALVREELSGARKIVDLFCGCGTFSLPLARSASVRAFDADAPAVESLLRAASAAQAMGLGVNPVEARERDLFERPLSARELKGSDAIIFDPPRAGAEEQARMIAASDAPVVIGVSCNPASFACDAAILVAGGYRLDRVTPIDQFVYAAHVELVGVFRR